MTCTYTGARVFFAEYGYLVPADLYKVGDCVIIRWNTNGKEYGETEGQFTHNVPTIRNGWHREDIGVTVIPESALMGPVYR